MSKPANQIPVQKGQTYNIEIHGLGSNGEGVGKYENFTVFVPFALPGEMVEARITLVKKQYATGKLQKVVQPSADRIKPVCPVYYQCGGCQLQHLSYAAELREKRQQVVDALTRIGHLPDVEVLPTLGSPSPLGYRNKMQFPAAGGKGHLEIGCFAAATHHVIDVDSCAIQKEQNNQILSVVRQWMKQYKIPAYDEDRRTGIVRHVMGRVGVNTGDIMVCLVTASDMVPHMKDLVQMLRKELPGLKSVVQNVNTRHTNVILGNKMREIYGQSTIRDTLGSLMYNISAQSFFQVNSEQAHKLYAKALEFAELKGDETIADVYCGTGTITLAFAQQVKQAYGIEIVAPAIKNAIQNARDNRIHNAEFLLGDAAFKLPELIKNGVHPDIVVLDPPRAGCEEKVLAAIARTKPRRVVYISCNPATLARDMEYLTKHGFAAIKAQPVDMFSRTHHVETVVLMSRVEK